jgi:hypothetical protein
MNPAPDADYHSVGPDNFEWIVDKVTKLAIQKAGEFTGEPMQGLGWSRFLTGGSAPEVSAPSEPSGLAPAEKPAVKR